ncbi:MAG TPA: hypothetical protein DCM44_00680 [Pantoea sp.]|nr:hypothetical protein [Pantoea sp.]
MPDVERCGNCTLSV